jgi:hypothetical protein
MDAQNFEEMKAVKFQWLLRDFCCNLPSLKKASKYAAIHGIILNILILVLGAGGNFLLGGLGSPPEYNEDEYHRNDHRQLLYNTNGIIFVVIGTLLLIYNLVLLNRVRANRAVGVFKTIKVGCLVSLYVELITNLAHLVMHAYIFASHLDGLAVGILFSQSLFLLLTALGIYGIHDVRPKIVSAYIYFKAIFYALVIILFLVLMTVFNDSRTDSVRLLIIPFILMVIFVYYYLKIFVLQVNMMMVSPVIHDHHQLINASEDKV